LVSASLKVEAVLDDFVPAAGDSGNSGSGQLHTHYSNETLANMPRILAERFQQLNAIYCGQVTRDLALFAVEHGPAFGVNNLTKPGFDAYDVAQRVLMVLETIDEFPVVGDAIAECRGTVSKKHGPAGGGTPKRQHALWILVCMAEKQEQERESRSGNEVFLRWTAHIDANAAMDALGHVLRCPQQMIRLAAHQIDVEYRRDALFKAAATGKFSQESLNATLAKIPLPSRTDYQRVLLSARNKTLVSFPFPDLNHTIVGGIHMAPREPIKTTPCSEGDKK